MRKQLHTYILYFSIAIFAVFTAVLLAASLYLNEGKFIYVLDDPYIHMTIAKNFSSLGTWAVNGMQFTSAASSPLWSLLISGLYYLTGPLVFIPFILNMLFSLGVIIIAFKILRIFNVPKYGFAVLLAIIFVSPLPALAFTGMEHIAQIFFVLLFVYTASKEGGSKIVFLLSLILIFAVLTSLRYEDMFLVFAVSLVLVLKKEYLPAAVILAAGLAPIIAYGMISDSNGWFFLPNPVLVKSRLPDLTFIEIAKIPLRAVKRMFEPDIIFLLPPIIFVFVKNLKTKPAYWNRKQTMFFIFLITYVLHMIFAQTGWFYRYEAYLVAMGIIVLWLNIYEYLPDFSGKFSRGPGLILITILILSIAARSASNFLVPQASNNIYNQHYQMARFVGTLPPETVVAANDIGMLNFYTPNKIIDLWGLADLDAAKNRISRTYDTDKIRKLAKDKNVELAVVYKDWFDQFGGLPPEWQKTGQWQMDQLNIVNGNETVSFYSLDSARTEFYRAILNDFSYSLPEKVLFKPN